jgi:PAS domain S-box-containing protein
MDPHGPAEISQALPYAAGIVSAPMHRPPSLFSKRRWYVRAFFVVFFVVLATLLRFWLNRRFNLDLHYITYFPTVFLLASLFGTVEGIYATIASVLIGIDPLTHGTIAALTTANKVSLVFLAFSGIALSIVAGALRNRTERLQHALEELRAFREKITDEQRRLHEATERFHTVVEAAEEAITSIDTSGILTSWNKGAEAMFGYSAADMIGRPFRDLLPRGAGADAEAKDILARLSRGETVEKLNVQRVAQDGRTLHVNLTVTPVRDEAGTIVGASSVTRDITEHLKLQDDQRRLLETTSRFHSVLAASDEAIIGKDIRGNITSWNKGAEAIFGYTAEEMIGQPIHRLLPVDHESEENEILTHILRGETVERLDVQRVAKDGQTVHLNIIVSPIRDASGKIIGASKVARDITEQLNLQRQLQQSQKMEAIGQLAGGIAHDFNNLLAIISGALELQLPAISGNQEATHRWEVASRAARRGAELTRRLLAFSSIEHFKIAPTDLNHSIRNTVEMAQRLIGPEIKMHLNLEKAIGHVLVDPAGLESAVLNLVINARDAMLPRGGTLTIGTRTAELEESFTATLTGPIQAGSYACISITDTGCGMTPEILDRACEPFFTTKERGRGTGLGLSMVYGFVKHSGGGIRIYSEVGYGTTITFYLPFELTDRAAPATAHPLLQTSSETRRTGRILIVDDETELLDISVSYLAARGYTAVSAHGGKEALDLLSKEGPVDVLITDIVMGGGMDGMELAQQAHSLYPAMRIIYSSGFPADALSTRSLPLADSLVLQKPYRLSELGASIDHALGIRQLLASVPTPAATATEDVLPRPPRPIHSTKCF